MLAEQGPTPKEIGKSFICLFRPADKVQGTTFQRTIHGTGASTHNY